MYMTALVINLVIAASDKHVHDKFDREHFQERYMQPRLHFSAKIAANRYRASVSVSMIKRYTVTYLREYARVHRLLY